MKNRLLLPYQLKPAGWLLTAAGAAVGIARFWYGVKFSWLDLKVFALYSQFIETKSFSLITNNATEELSGILLLAGLVLVALSAEQAENEKTAELRLNAFLTASYANAAFLLLALLFFFGLGFVYLALINLYSWIFLYILIFRISLLRLRKTDKS